MMNPDQILHPVRLSALLASLFFALGDGKTQASINVVAAENFYGDVAQQIGGDQVDVTSILTNPDQDPHLFTVNVDTARAVPTAQIVIYSGIDYDPWMEDMTAAHPNPNRVVTNVSALIHAAKGDNPHIWYSPATMPALAQKLAADLGRLAPAHTDLFHARLAKFLASLKPLNDRIAALKAKYAGTDVLATEPVFGYMAGALGFKMHAMGFQNHVMNNTEPTAQESEEFETLLKSKKVKLLFYNGQVTDPITTRMQGVAKAAGVPIIGVTETEPSGTSYVPWMLSQLDAVQKALGSPRP
jgi:zinc/manganese transport system substrate-binding protein